VGSSEVSNKSPYPKSEKHDAIDTKSQRSLRYTKEFRRIKQ